MPENRQVLIDSLPEEKLRESNFKTVTSTVPEPMAALLSALGTEIEYRVPGRDAVA